MTEKELREQDLQSSIQSAIELRGFLTWARHHWPGQKIDLNTNLVKLRPYKKGDELLPDPNVGESITQGAA